MKKKTEENMVKCIKCGKLHKQKSCNCCWIYCDCGTKICGSCGSDNLIKMNMNEDDDEAHMWCCLKCDDCGLKGCTMCI